MHPIPPQYPSLVTQMQYILVNTVYDGPFPQVTPYFPLER